MEIKEVIVDKKIPTLTKVQQDIFEAVNDGKIQELKIILSTNKIKVDFVDENGMTPLQHACYKGSKDIVEMLIDHGADPNKCDHPHQYTPLHFAALSGNADLCQLLLSAGAKSSALNSVGRTPSQMAAFVGNHHCSVMINNFIPKSTLDYYLVPQGLQTEPMLSPVIADSFYSLITQINIHPVRVLMNLQKYPGLRDNLPMIRSVLELMRKKEMSKGSETNEVLAFKYSYLYTIVNEIIKFEDQTARINNGEEKNEDDKPKQDVISLFIRKLIKPPMKGCSPFMDTLLKKAVYDFSYHDSAIFRQIAATLSTPDPPSCLSVIVSAINGQRAFDDDAKNCDTCNEEKAMKKCSKCKKVQYCDRECQKTHWFIHKLSCDNLNEEQ
ncbi:hypothetical protein QAD02_011383 [Eretmocerus hayati]|uniref:Uncharacterized protein n=1 Tax=Eretmocerus hayati TaxID=131215 RepID=A0ACC2NZF9_9HYME|nr:hypothetical protein QAD02_011383 [Eretmocerus hayati]